MRTDTSVFPTPLLEGLPITDLTMIRVNSSVTSETAEIEMSFTPQVGGISSGGYFLIDFPLHLINAPFTCQSGGYTCETLMHENSTSLK
jgi:hypothetical protein